MDHHDVCRIRIQNLEELLAEAHEREADLEIELGEKESLIASLTAELVMLRRDREFVA